MQILKIMKKQTNIRLPIEAHAQAVYEYIVEFYNTKPYMPSYREIGLAFQKSDAYAIEFARRTLEVLVKQKKIKINKNKRRAIELI